MKSQPKKQVKSQTVFTIKTFIKLHHIHRRIRRGHRPFAPIWVLRHCSPPQRRSTTNSLCGAIGCNREIKSSCTCREQWFRYPTPSTFENGPLAGGVSGWNRNISDLDFPGNPQILLNFDQNRKGKCMTSCRDRSSITINF